MRGRSFRCCAIMSRWSDDCARLWVQERPPAEGDGPVREARPSGWRRSGPHVGPSELAMKDVVIFENIPNNMQQERNNAQG
jgi:hypothetical protein